MSVRHFFLFLVRSYMTVLRKCCAHTLLIVLPVCASSACRCVQTMVMVGK